MHPPDTGAGVDEDGLPILIHNVTDALSDASSSSFASDIEDSDSQNEDFLGPSQPRRQRRNTGNRIPRGSYASRASTASEAINSWVSSYARSAGFLEDTAPPGQRVRRRSSAEDKEDADLEAPELLPFSDEFVDDDEMPDRTRRQSYGTIGDGEDYADKTTLPVIEDHGPQPMSTFAQTVFNAVNLLMGIGILSLPFAFRITGWIIGGILLVTCCLMTHHTARLLAYCLDYTPPPTIHEAPTATRRLSQPLLTTFPKIYHRACTYGDIGELAYGRRGRNFIALLFCFELLAAGVALVILISDSITALFPNWHHAIVKTVAVCLITPMTWPMSLSWASYGSLIGVVALVNLMVIIMVDGLSVETTPGSLWNPAETRAWPKDWGVVPLAIGLIMAGFCGHSVFPNVYRDMVEPQKYPRMLNLSYILTTIVYVFIAACGYLMFGDYTMPEITQNLPLVPGYPRILNQLTLWLTAVNPMTKFPLTVNPINVQIEYTLQTHFPNTFPTPLPLLYRMPLRTLTALLVLSIAILLPTFHSVMSLLGSFFAFMVCVVFPGCCYLRLYGSSMGRWEKVREWMVVVAGVVLGALGTCWAVFFGGGV